MDDDLFIHRLTEMGLDYELQNSTLQAAANRNTNWDKQFPNFLNLENFTASGEIWQEGDDLELPEFPSMAPEELPPSSEASPATSFPSLQIPHSQQTSYSFPTPSPSPSHLSFRSTPAPAPPHSAPIPTPAPRPSHSPPSRLGTSPPSSSSPPTSVPPVPSPPRGVPPPVATTLRTYAGVEPPLPGSRPSSSSAASAAATATTSSFPSSSSSSSSVPSSAPPPRPAAPFAYHSDRDSSLSPFVTPVPSREELRLIGEKRSIDSLVEGEESPPERRKKVFTTGDSQSDREESPEEEMSELQRKALSSRQAHVTAEQKRRNIMKVSFATLKSKIPKFRDAPNVSKAAILQGAIEYIGALSEASAEVVRLRRENEELKRAMGVPPPRKKPLKPPLPPRPAGEEEHLVKRIPSEPKFHNYFD